MIFLNPLGRRAGAGLRRGLGLAALAGLGLLGACGGGTSQVEDFVPLRMIALGDETSALTADGRKFSVNVLDADDALECQSEPIWTQAVARSYGFVFAQCNPDAVADPRALMAAVPGAKVADLAAQIDAQIAAGTLGTRTLVTVMMGANDVWEVYERFAQDPSLDTGALLGDLRARGERLAAQVNRLVDRDARVVVATLPDLGKSPFALAERAAHTDTDRAALISSMTAALNGRMRANIVNDGRFIGLVLADEMVQALVKAPSGFGLANATEAACLDTAPLPDCTNKTLVTGGRSSTWLWADGRHLAYGGQVRLGNLAVARANDNPF